MLTQRPTQKYNKYKYHVLAVLSVYSLCYLKHNYTKNEFEMRKQPNILIPMSVYEVRRKHYIYWELSRVARGYRKTFTYYNYDKEGVNQI